MVIALYYSFTTLSTVGFGDFHPVDTHEMIFCIFIMFFGVMIFSLVMGIFIEMLEKLKTVHCDLEDASGLSKFTDLLKFFNNGKDIPLDFKDKLERYFEYRWSNDRNSAIDDDDEKFIL